ncbi:MAG: response regulator transcription factor [Alphaproteobacteria bacterium]|nr:response regulator transcription factor [Alphaproteobacteria bacterium]
MVRTKDVFSILVVDDDERIRQLLSQFLINHGYRVTGASCAAQARSFIASHSFDLYILDIMMPGSENGLDLAQSLRMNPLCPPIILLTARDTLNDKITGFNHGADDYIIKPFEPLELLARIQAMLRRNQHNLEKLPEKRGLCFGPVEFDAQTARLWNADKQEIPLSSTEQILLKTLAQEPFKPFSRNDLCQKAGFTVGERTIDVQITRLRKKLGDNIKQSQYIKTIRHVGYALYPDILE